MLYFNCETNLSFTIKMENEKSKTMILYEELVDFFGSNNVKKDQLTIGVRPLWIDGAGSGYRPDVDGMVSIIENCLKQSKKLTYQYTVSCVPRLVDLPFLNVRVNDQLIGIIMIFHTPWF